MSSNLSAFIDETGREKPAPEVIQGIVGRDTAMAAYFLKSAGSGFFGDMSGESKINNIMESLGPEIVRDLVVEYRVFSSFAENSREDQLAAGISEHSTRVSELAARIAREEGCGPEVVSDSETAGLLHDMGRNIFLSYNDSSSDISALADEWSSEFHEFEEGVTGLTHAGAGAVLGTYWGYAERITRAIRYHHNPSGASEGDFDCLTAVHAAESLLLEENGSENCFDMKYLEGLGIDDKIDKWRGLIAEKVIA
jgi:putative nucleotidyltransferase with HDIG domain